VEFPHEILYTEKKRKEDRRDTLCASPSLLLPYIRKEHSSCHGGQGVGSWFSRNMHLDNYEIHKLEIGTNFNVLSGPQGHG